MLRGRLPGTASVVEIEFNDVLTSVDELIRPPETEDLLAPGFVDLQVNGFAGVDYNDPAASHEAIAQSIRTMFRTGVTRFFPTLITGSEQMLLAALRKLTAAKQEFSRNGMPEAQAMEAFHME